MGKRKKPVSQKGNDKQAVVQPEFFTPGRLILLFVLIEIGIVLLMKDNFKIRYYTNRARESYQTGDFSKAEHYWQKLLKIAPRSATVNLELAQTYFQLGKYHRAIGCYQVVLREEAGKKSIHTYIGLCHQRLGDRERALEYFMKELETNPMDVHANFFIGKSLFDKKKYIEAAVHFQRIGNYSTYRKELKQYWEKIEKAIFGS